MLRSNTDAHALAHVCAYAHECLHVLPCRLAHINKFQNQLNKRRKCQNLSDDIHFTLLNHLKNIKLARKRTCLLAPTFDVPSRRLSLAYNLQEWSRRWSCIFVVEITQTKQNFWLLCKNIIFLDCREDVKGIHSLEQNSCEQITLSVTFLEARGDDTFSVNLCYIDDNYIKVTSVVKE